ncbi:hypothetical protein F4782DRAFT_320430 [Xylaria castorea]|nr:hypothetical protein F4782DRAFT_320430 [Xylaria castorea]
MSITVLSQTNWHDQARASIDSFAAHQSTITPSSRAMLWLVSCYDSVTFDFSDWTPEQLNEDTRSFWGLHSGSLDIGCYNLSNGNLTDEVHAMSRTADSEDSQSGKDIVCLHDWCVDQARAEHGYVEGQRFFRFEKGRYTSSLPFPGLRAMQTAIKEFLSSVRSR